MKKQSKIAKLRSTYDDARDVQTRPIRDRNINKRKENGRKGNRGK